MKVAIIHDWLIAGGAERVVEELHHIYPEAPIYTSYATQEWCDRLNGKVKTGWLQHFPQLRKYVPFLRIWWFTRLDLRDYDLVISSSGAEAKGIKRLKPGALHINYCHAPTHYCWSRYEEYLQHPGFGMFDPLARLGLKILVGPLRHWDYKAAQRPNFIIANSTHIQQEIKKYYGRKSTVIFPPVDTARFAKTSNKNRSGFVIAGRQTPYKKIGLAVAACTKLNLPLTVVGSGPDHEKLVHMAGPTITFAPPATDQDVANYFASAQAFIFPGLDDFGITPVEAMATGLPVIAYKAGGALDYVIPGKTGEFFTPQTVDSLVKTLSQFNPKKYRSRDIMDHAKTFDTKIFRQKVSVFIGQHLD